MLSWQECCVSWQIFQNFSDLRCRQGHWIRYREREKKEQAAPCQTCVSNLCVKPVSQDHPFFLWEEIGLHGHLSPRRIEPASACWQCGAQRQAKKQTSLFFNTLTCLSVLISAVDAQHTYIHTIKQIAILSPLSPVRLMRQFFSRTVFDYVDSLNMAQTQWQGQIDVIIEVLDWHHNCCSPRACGFLKHSWDVWLLIHWRLKTLSLEVCTAGGKRCASIWTEQEDSSGRTWPTPSAEGLNACGILWLYARAVWTKVRNHKAILQDPGMPLKVDCDCMICTDMHWYARYSKTTSNACGSRPRLNNSLIGVE